MDKGFDLGLQISHPLHREQRLERGVLHWVGDVWKSVIGEELRGLGQIRAFSVQELLEFSLLSLELLLLDLLRLILAILIVRMDYIHHEVDVEVEL